MPPRVTGYVLAGGRSSRMGQDKALLQIDGETLLARAVAKLRDICGDVYILGAYPAYADFAPLAPDLHPDCGPMSGLEAALAHCPSDWALVLPVDLPCLPVALLREWIEAALSSSTTRLALFTVDGIPQPTVALLHRAVLPYLAASIARGRYKLYPVLREAAAALTAEQGVAEDAVLADTVVADDAGWFRNVNTPEEFAAVQAATASERE
ncbi:molybdopterin-guanine dinucleotide biosynthesis protein A/molybdopterin-guanine dinucleotide biosynthesis protein B [Granulicella rosea]|uniref:Probable molybdenum cofactor guanylyltransferase n=1 Tax=Granulicella rosea TaxID=474952 RepID=A0A239J684_9BACT|nr:molybdenum cofactor guanylyltransferase [Granulicella rosea]SNT01172.1 molybdopterin-guanine dinucleotide biosynthesis protein A/molybdopterin-guanine dinucleotide biosynthesis protein B [Granulicella rosea]